MPTIFRALIPLLGGLVLLASCQEVAHVAPQDELPKGQVDSFVSDDDFAPRLTSIQPYEFCPFDFAGRVSSSCDTDIAEKTVFGDGVIRFLFIFDKPVHFELVNLADIKLSNAKLYNSAAAELRFVPLEEVTTTGADGDPVTEWQEVSDPDTSKAYMRFTTKAEDGTIQPESDGEFTVNIPGDLFYSVNPNGGKVYNHGLSATYTYDNTPPKATISFSLDEMNSPSRLMSPSARGGGDLKNYASITMYVDWGETVTPAGSLSQLTFSDGSSTNRMFDFLCSGCVGGVPYNDGAVKNADGNGLEYLGANPPTNSIYRFKLTETDISDDLMKKLNGANSITFQVEKGSFVDVAGNASEQDFEHQVRVDSEAPTIEDIEITTSGTTTPAAAVNGQQRILNQRDTITFRVNYSEDVTLLSNKYSVLFSIGGQSKAATLSEAEARLLGTYKDSWDFVYEIQESDGDNLVNSTVRADNTLDISGNQYIGSNSVDGSTDTSWESDISLGIKIDEDPGQGVAAVDRVGLPRVATGLKPLTDYGGNRLNGLHIDGVRPEIVQSKIGAFSSLLSAGLGASSTSVHKDEKLAVAIPFSEVLVNPLNTEGLDFTDDYFENATITAYFCDTEGVLTLSECDAPSNTTASETLTYDRQLTAAARDITTDSDFEPYKYRTLVFSLTVDERHKGIKTVLVQNPKIPGLSMDTYTDIAGNTFADADRSATGFILTKPLSLFVEGGGFRISSLRLLDKSTDASGDTYSLASIPDGENRYYNNDNANLYIEAFLTKEIEGNPSANDAQLVLRIEDATGNEQDITSDSVGLVNNEKNRLVFSFDLSNGNQAHRLQDYDGISVKEITSDNLDPFTNSGATLDITISANEVSNLITQRSYIDTSSPTCNSVLLTNNPNGSEPSGRPIQFGTRAGGGAAQSLYLAVKCDQQIIFTSRDGDADNKPFIPVDFGGVNQVFTYYGISTTGPVFALPSQAGFTRGDGDLQAGVVNEKKINWHFVNNQRVGDGTADHVFFHDRGGNKLDLTSLPLSNGYLLEGTLYDPDATNDATNDVVVDTRPYPVAINWPGVSDFSSDYYRSGGKVYISGAPGINRFRFSIDYGRNLGGEQTTDLNPADSGIYHLSGKLLDEDDNELGDFYPVSVSGNRIVFDATFDYSADLVDKSIANLGIRFSDYTTDTSAIAYTTASRTAKNHTTGAETDSTIDIPITEELRNTFFNTSQTNAPQLPNIIINAARPALTDIELYYDSNGDGVTTLSATEGANNDQGYGDFYIALKFDQDIRETGLENTYLNMMVDRSADTLTINDNAIEFVARTSLSSVFNTAADGARLTNDRLFYKFAFGETRYVGEGLTIEGTNDILIFDKTTDAQQAVSDIYGNRLDQSGAPTASYPVKLAATSEIDELGFDSTSYRYGDTIAIDLTTDRKLNDPSGGARRLALPLNVSINEGDSSARTTTIYARGTTINHSDSDGDGETKIRFTYSLTGLDAQFDSDAPNQVGLTPTGSLRWCDSDDNTADCSAIWEATNTSNGLRAVLSLDGYENLARVGSTLTRFVAKNTTDLLSSGLVNRLRYTPDGTTDERNVSAGNYLDTGDTIHFYLSPEFLDISPDTLRGFANNSLAGATTTSKLRFSLYNAISQARVSREADFDSLKVSNRQMVFKYTIQDGDLVHPQDSNLSPVSYTDAGGNTEATGDALALDVTSDNLFTNLSSGSLNGLTDSFYGNPVWGAVVDNSDDPITATAIGLLATQIQVDTRPRIKTIQGDATGDYSKGQSISFTITFDKNITVTNGLNNIKARVKVGGAKTDATADFSTVVGVDGLRLQFTVPDGVTNGAVLLDSLKLNGGSIRYNDGATTNMNAALEIPSANQVKGINIDSVEPQITGVSLLTSEGDYSLNTEVASQTLAIGLTLNKELDSTPDSGQLVLTLGVKKADDTTRDITLVSVASSSNTRQFVRLERDITELSNDLAHYHEDGDRLRVIDITSDGVTFEDAAGNNLLLGPGGFDSSSDDDPTLTVKQQIEGDDDNTDDTPGFRVNIDTDPPTITNLIFDNTDADNAAAIAASNDDCNTSGNNNCVKADQKVDFRLTYSEKVVFSNSSGSNFQLELTSDSDGGNLKANAVVEGGSLAQRTDTTTDYRYTLSEEFEDTNGISVVGFNISSGSHMRDRAGNDLSEDILSTLNPTNQAQITNISLDSEPPTLVNGAFVGGEYGAGGVIKLTLTYNEALEVSDDTLNLQVRFRTRQNSNVDRTFDYNTGESNPAGKTLVFDYTVDAINDTVAYTSAQYLSPISLNGAVVTDLHGNNATLSFTDGAADDDVEVDPAFSASIEGSIIAKKDNATIGTDPASPTYLLAGETLSFHLSYDQSVDVTSGTRDTGNEMGLKFYFGDSSGDTERTAVYKSGLGTKTLVFEYDISTDDEDRNGIKLASNSLVNVSETTNKLTKVGTSTLAATNVSGKFANDKRIGDSATSGQDDELETIRVSTLAPPDLESATFINATEFNTATGKVTIRVEKPSSGAEGIAKYLVQLIDVNAGNTVYTSNTPANVDTGSNNIFADPEANGLDVKLEIPSAMETTQCDPIRAKVWAVSAGGLISSGAVDTTARSVVNGKQNVFFNNTRPTLNTQSASGDATEDSFSDVDQLPTLTAPQTTAGCAGDTSEVLFNISYVDDTGDTQYLLPEDYEASDNATHYAMTSNYDSLAADVVDDLVPFREYTTTFVARDSSGLDSSTDSHSWTAFNIDLPLHYDASRDVEESGGTVTKWKNIGSGVSRVGAATSEDAAAFDLTPIISGAHNHYANVAPDYSAGAIVFPASNSERANLRFDLDSNAADGDSANHRHIPVADGQTGYTYFSLLSLPDLGVASGADLADGFDASDDRITQIGFYLGSGKYAGDHSYDNLESVNDSGLFGLVNKAKLADAVTDANNTNTYTHANAEARLGTSTVLVYQLHQQGTTNKFALCRYAGLRLLDDSDCATDYRLTIDTLDDAGFDKFYLGAAATSADGTRGSVNLLGSNAHNLKLYQLGLYNRILGDNAREKLTKHLAQSRQIPLILVNDAGNNRQLDIELFQGNTKVGNQLPIGSSAHGLTCFEGADSTADIDFPTMVLNNIPTLTELDDPKVHILIEQSLAGDKAGPYTYLHLVNLDYPSGSSASLIGSNNGSGTFTLDFNGVTVSAAQTVEAFSGLCHQYDNEYRFVAYVTDGDITKPATAQSIADFESGYNDSIQYKTIHTRNQQYTLDNIFPPKVGFSVRKLFNDYAGPAINVMRDSDDTTMDIGFSGLNLDTEQLLDFVTEHSSDGNGYVLTWYDQSGNDYNVVRSNTTYNRTPKIVHEGEVITRNNRPAIRFDHAHAGHTMMQANHFVINTKYLSYVATVHFDQSRPNSGNYNMRFLKLENGGYGFSNGALDNNIGGWASHRFPIRCHFPYFSEALETINDDNRDIADTNVLLKYVGSTEKVQVKAYYREIQIDGDIEPAIDTDELNCSFDSAQLLLGHDPAYSVMYLRGHIQELVFFDESKPALVDLVQENVNDYFQIYQTSK